MKNKKYMLFLLIEAVGVLGITKGMDIKAESIFDLLSSPLTALADGLGKLSLSGTFGNAFSVVIYALICLVPIFVLLFKVKKNTFRRVDSLLVLMSAVLFAVVYLLINPSEMGVHAFNEASASTVAFSFWSLFVGYLVLKFAETLKNTEGKKAEKLLSIVLEFIGAVFVFSLCTVKIPDTEVGIITVFSVLNSVLPAIFGIRTVFFALNLLAEFSLDRYSENTVDEAEKLSRFCILALEASVGVSALLSVLQLRFINELSSVNFSVEIPVFSLGFILLLLLLSGIIKESKALKEDNDSFI